MNSGQVKLNKDDVRNGIWTFIFSFIILSSFSFICIFTFFESSKLQIEQVEQNASNYRDMLNKNFKIQEKMGEIEKDLFIISGTSYIESESSRNNIYDKMKAVSVVIGEDSVKNFKHYATLVKNFRKIMNQKEALNNINRSVDNAKQSLAECSGKINNFKKQTEEPKKKAYVLGSRVTGNN